MRSNIFSASVGNVHKKVYDVLDKICHIPLKWQQINKNAIHPSTDQGRMQKVGIRPNYTQGALLLTRVRRNILR